jgi:hypothetical protein
MRSARAPVVRYGVRPSARESAAKRNNVLGFVSHASERTPEMATHSSLNDFLRVEKSDILSSVEKNVVAKYIITY